MDIGKLDRETSEFRKPQNSGNLRIQNSGNLRIQDSGNWISEFRIGKLDRETLCRPQNHLTVRHFNRM